MNYLLEYHELLLALSGFLIISLAANQIARFFQKIKLPLITGLIIAGIISGPYLIGLIPLAAKDHLNFINETALAYIAFAAGAELYLKELRSKIRTIQINSFVQTAVGFLLGSLLIYLLADFIPFVQGLSFENKLAIALLVAVLFVAPSPASVIAVISELRAKGPFTKTMLGVTMAKDFLVVILFAIVLSISKSFVDGSGINLADLLIIGIELAASFLVAYLIGKILQFILGLTVPIKVKIVLVLTLGYLSYTLSHFLKDFSSMNLGHEVYLEPLLICLIASFYIVNYTNFRPEFLKILHDVSLPVYVFFFTLTGASMNLVVLAEMWPFAIGFFIIRLLTLVIGTYSGVFISKDVPKPYHVSWFPYVAQAGVALGLVTVVSTEFPEWGEDFAAISIAAIIINQLVGPPLIARSITIMKEDRSRANTPEFDGILDAIIFGLESQSIALARQLIENNWEVQLVTQKPKGSFEEPEGIVIRYITTIQKAEFDKMNADKTEAIVCMLSDEENLKICEIAYHEIGTRDLIVRLNKRANYDKFLALGARIVDPSTAIVSLLDHFVRSPQATSLLLGMEKGQDTRDIELLNPDLHGITLRDLRLPSDVIILSIMRGGQTIISHGYTRLRIKDIVTVVGSIKSLNEVQFKFER